MTGKGVTGFQSETKGVTGRDKALKNRRPSGVIMNFQNDSSNEGCDREGCDKDKLLNEGCDKSAVTPLKGVTKILWSWMVGASNFQHGTLEG